MRSPALVVVFLTAWVAAQEPAPRPPADPFAALQAEIAAARAELALLRELPSGEAAVVHGAVRVDVATHYLFRGLPQEDQGLIAQPAAKLTFRLVDELGPLRAVDVELASWNSLHDGPTSDGRSAWYEADASGSVGANVGERLRFTAGYTNYSSPSSSFGMVQEVSVGAALDDRGLLLAGGLSPSVLFAWETAGQADAGQKRGTFVELGVTPALPLASGDGAGLEARLPVRVGLGMTGYYESSTGGASSSLGFVDAGLVLACTLPAARSALRWRIECGVHGVWLGDTNRERNGDDGHELVGRFGFALEF